MRQKIKQKTIVEAARERFAHYGYSKVTMEEIASDVELGKASLYYYFPAKENLFKAVILLEQNELIEKIELILKKSEPASQKLREYVELRMKFFQELMNLGTLSLHSTFETRSIFKKLFVDLEKIELSLIQKIIDEGKSTKEFDPKLPSGAAIIFLHILQGLRCRIMRWHKGRSLDKSTYNNLQKEMRTVTDLFICGIKYK